MTVPTSDVIIIQKGQMQKALSIDVHERKIKLNCSFQAKSLHERLYEIQNKFLSSRVPSFISLRYLGALVIASTQYVLVELDRNKQSLIDFLKCKLLSDA